VQSITGATIVMQQPCWYNLLQRPGQSIGAAFPSMWSGTVPSYIENAYPLLHAGQWYLDNITHTIYYMTSPGQMIDNLDVELPQLEELLVGSSAHDMVFEGITFSGTTWNDTTNPSTSIGFSDIQANLRITQSITQQQTSPQALCTASLTAQAGSCPFGSYDPPPTAVQFNNCVNITVSNSVFTGLGTAALGIYGNSQNTQIQGNQFSYIASSAIEIGSPWDAPASSEQALRDTTVEDNLIHHIGTGYPSAPAITLFYSLNTSILHNEIFHVPYDGISSGVAGGHVDTPTNPDISSNINSGNNISANAIHNFLESLADGGAIYLEGHQGQSWNTALTVGSNVAYANIELGKAYYTDIGSEWVNLDSNMLWDFSGYGAITGCEPIGHLHTVGNYYPVGMVIGTYSVCWSGTLLDTVNQNNIAISDMPGSADLPNSMLAAAGLEPAYQSLALTLPPEIDYSGVSMAASDSSLQVLIGGTNFVSSPVVALDGIASSTTAALSDEFAVADFPALSGALAFPRFLTVQSNQGAAQAILEANTVGTLADGTALATGGLDGSGSAYSAGLLGSSLYMDGVAFPFAVDRLNAVTAAGQSIVLPPASARKLILLGGAANGAQAGQTFTVTYSDGTAATFTQGLSDWTAPSAFAGETTLLTMSYRNLADGSSDATAVSLYGYEFALDATKTPAGLSLPNNPNCFFLGIAVAP
jgi:hypothetical protein